MAESLRGSYAFSILDSTDTLWLVRGDSPLAFVHFPKYRLYVYASTETILYKSLVGNKLFDEVKTGNSRIRKLWQQSIGRLRGRFCGRTALGGGLYGISGRHGRYAVGRGIPAG